MQTQKNYLSDAKKALEARIGERLTWDEFAVHAGIEPRALKTYRMPETSADYRVMPALAKQAIEALTSKPTSRPQDVRTLVSALAALVVAQAKISLIDRQIISGMDKRSGSRNGLTEEDRKIMAMVSRFSLGAGLSDFGGEIHNLLFHCTKPLQDWLKIPALLDAGYGPTVLIDPDYGIPTPEAQELASGFSNLSAHLEERLFSALKDNLSKFPSSSADDYYTVVREMIVRNPVVSVERLFEYSKRLPGTLWVAIQQEFYEPVPIALTTDSKVQLCAHCNSMMKPAGPTGSSLRCQSRACNNAHSSKLGDCLPIQEARRDKRGIHQYWVEPGIDELALYDAMRKAGLAATLYPFQDRVDIAVGNIGIDLKTYVSPEILGAKFKKSIGGLSHYEHKWVVIPDWLVTTTHDYLARLRDAMGENAKRLRCMSLSQALALAKKDASHA